MAVSTYTELKARALTLIARSSLSVHVADWVEMAEKAIIGGWSGQAGLRVREMEKIATGLYPSSGAIALPSDFLGVGELRLADNLDIELNWLPTKQLYGLEDSSFGDGSGYWDIVGSNIIVRPTPGDTQEYWLKYFYKPAALTETTQETNEIFPAYSDLYVNGTMWQAFEHVRNTEQADRYLQKMLAGIAQYNARWKAEKAGSGALQMCAPVVA